MAEAPRHNISPSQFFTIILSAQIGIGILSLPRILAIREGHSGWVFIIPIGILTLLGTWVSFALCKRVNGSIVTANRRILGQTLGAFASFMVFSILLISTVMHFAYFTQTLMLFFFKETPLVILAVFIYIPAFYLVLKGLKILGRFDSFVFLAVFMVFGVFLAVYKRIHWTFLYPVLEINQAAIPAVLKETAFSFIGFELLLVFYPWIRGTENKKKLAVFGAPALTTFIYLFFTIMVIGLFGEEYIHHQVFPIVNLIRSIQIPILERLDIYFISIWLPAMGTNATAYLAATQLVADEIFPKISYKVLLWGISLMVIGAQLFLNKFVVFEQISSWVGLIELGMLGILFPILLLPIAWIRGVKP